MSNEEKNLKNDPLPDFSDKFWPEGSDNQTHTLKQISCLKHNFKMTKVANEVKCVDCGVGYLLSPGMNLRPDGHVYYEYGLFVI